jgi:hypothetical protein
VPEKKQQKPNEVYTDLEHNTSHEDWTWVIQIIRMALVNNEVPPYKELNQRFTITRKQNSKKSN